MPRFLHLGLPDRNIDHGDCETLLKREGLDFLGIKESIINNSNEISYYPSTIGSDLLRSTICSWLKNRYNLYLITNQNI